MTGVDADDAASNATSDADCHNPENNGQSLYDKARMLVADEDLMTGMLDGDALDAAVRRKAQRVMAASRRVERSG